MLARHQQEVAEALFPQRPRLAQDYNSLICMLLFFQPLGQALDAGAAAFDDVLVHLLVVRHGIFAVVTRHAK
jgi:hypothetical protein